MKVLMKNDVKKMRGAGLSAVIGMLFFVFCGLVAFPVQGANELEFVGDGKSGSLTNELNYGSSVRQYVTNPTADNRWRVGTGTKGGTYSVSLPDDYSLLGALWVYVWGDSHITLDGRGADFRQWAREDGSAVNNVGNAFAVNNNAYGNYQIELSRPSATAASFRFVDSLQTFERNSVENTFKWNLSTGIFSFAEPDGASSSQTLVLGNSNVKPNSLFEMNLNNVTSYFPTTDFRCYNTNDRVRVSGGRLYLAGSLKIDTNVRLGEGTNEFVAVNEAVIEQPSGSIYIGSSSMDNPDRITRMVLDGTGTEYLTPPAPKYSELLMKGLSELHITGGAKFKAGELVYIGNNVSDGLVDAPRVIVSGQGSFFDASRTRLMTCFRKGGMEVLDGARAVLPASGLNFGEKSGDCAELVIAGEGTEVILTNNSTSANIYFPLGRTANSTGIVTVAGGTLTTAPGTKGEFRIGAAAGSFGRLDVAGGRFVLPEDIDVFYIGLNGSAEVNVTGGELIASNMVRGSLSSGVTTNTTVLRQTGGSILFYNGFNMNYQATSNFICDVYLEGGVIRSDYISGGNTALSRVHADGGTLLPRQSRTDEVWSFLYGIDLFEIGGNGLTIDTDGKNVRSRQYFVDFQDEDGLFVKKGSGTLTMSTNRYDVAVTKVEAGTLLIDKDDAVYDTALFVGDGAIFSTVGDCTKLTLSSLAITNGTFALDPGDAVIVEGNASFSGFKIDFSSLPESEDSVKLLDLTVKGELDEDSRRELIKVLCLDDPSAARHYKVSVVADETSGETQVSIEYSSDEQELDAAADTVWNGNGGWNDADAWNSGVPGAGKRAVFNGTGASATSVTVASDALVGAVRFESGNYLLSGGTLTFGTSKGTACIDVRSGSHEISSPVVAGVELTADVEYGASLTVSGDLVSRGMNKNGAGWLHLTGALDYMGMLGFGAGSVRFASSRENTVLDSLVVTNVVDGVPAIVVADAETTVGHIGVIGAIIKRGASKFVLDVTESEKTSNLTTFKPPTVNGEPESSSLDYGFPDDGSVPEGGYGGFTVAEGEFVIKGDADSPTVRMNGSCVIGMNSTNTTDRTMLTIDGAKVDNFTGNSAVHFFVGAGAAHYNGGGHYQVNPTLRILNGGVLRIDTLKTGHGFWGYYETHPIIAMTNAYLHAAYPGLTTHDSPISYPKWFTKNSYVFAHPVAGRLISVHGAVDAVFDSTYIGPGDYATLTPRDDVEMPMGNNNWSHARSKGSVSFVNGSRVRVSDFVNYAKIENEFIYIWDDSEWDYGGGDHEFAADKFHVDNFEFRMQGRGLILRPDSGSTFTVGFPFTGDGGFVNAGEGTVKFASGAYGFDGVCEVRSGTVDLTDAGTLSSVKVKGNGTIKGLSAKSVRVMASADDDWNVNGVPTFDGLSLGRVTVDFGKSGDSLSDDLPKGIVLGKIFGGAVVDVSSWRVANTGFSKVGGRFSIDDDGVVSVDLERMGMSIIVR